MTFESPVVCVESASGGLSRQLRSDGFRNVTAFDVSGATGGATVPSPELLGELENDRIVAIVFDDSLTRCEDPLAWLTAARRRISGPAARVVMSVPAAQGPVWEEFRDNWVSLDPPSRCWIPTLSGIHRLAENAGFVVSRVEGSCDSWQLACSELIARRIPPTTDQALVFSTAEQRHFRQRARGLTDVESSPALTAVLLPRVAG